MAAALIADTTRRLTIGALGGRPLLLTGEQVSLRRRKRSAGGLGHGGSAHATRDGAPRAGRRRMRRVTLIVNGEKVTAEMEPRMQLADFLRDVCLLTGTHVGCEHGVCGACTLLLDGAPARSCIAYAAACEGADVRTIEGLQDDPDHAAPARGFHRRACVAMRLLHAGHAGDRARYRAARAGRGCREHPLGTGREFVPLHRVCRHRAGDQPRAAGGCRSSRRHAKAVAATECLGVARCGVRVRGAARYVHGAGHDARGAGAAGRSIAPVRGQPQPSDR